MNEFRKLFALALEEIEIAALLIERKHYRTCLSRSYYAMYYAVQALLLSKDLDTSTHKGTIRLFSQHFVKTGQLSSEWSKALNTAYELRQLSDYDTDFTGTLAEAEMSLEKAKTFVKEIEQLLNPFFP